MAKSIELDGVRYTKIQLIKRINKIQDSIKNLEELYNKTTKPEYQENEEILLGDLDNRLERQAVVSQLMSAEKLLDHLEVAYKLFDHIQNKD